MRIPLSSVVALTLATASSAVDERALATTQTFASLEKTQKAYVAMFGDDKLDSLSSDDLKCLEKTQKAYVAMFGDDKLDSLSSDDLKSYDTFASLENTQKAYVAMFGDDKLDALSSDDLKSYDICMRESFDWMDFPGDGGDFWGNKLDDFIRCLGSRGSSFNPNSIVWVNEVNDHCNSIDIELLGEFQITIGNHYNMYKNCLQDRLVEPNYLTVSEQYKKEVMAYCWNDKQDEAKILTFAVKFAVEELIDYATGQTIQKGLKKLRELKKIGEVSDDVIEKGTDLFMDTMEEFDINLSGIISDLIPNLDADDWGFSPRAVENHAEYKQCLLDRQVPGLTFKPVSQSDPENWSEVVLSFCRNSPWKKVQFPGMFPDKLRQCLADRDVDRYYDDAQLTEDVLSHCDWAVIGGRAQSHNEYKQCLSERGIAFVQDNKWNVEVKEYCMNSQTGGGFKNYNGYKQCLKERGVAFQADEKWKAGVKKYCLNSQVGGGVKNYKGYKQCLKERGVAFQVDENWKTGVKKYCLNSQVGGGVKNYKGYKQCLKERSVSFAANSGWCSMVRDYCNAQWYPFGGKAKCYSERSCRLRRLRSI